MQRRRTFDGVGTAEAARQLDIHPQTVRRLLRDGHLPGVKFEDRWVIDRGGLDAFAQTYDGRVGVRWP